MLVLPADHVIGDVQAFQYSVSLAAPLAEAGYLVTFGVVPTQPETGYGYIACGEALEGGHHLAAFIEKPNAQRAAELVESGDYLWNSGMFLLRASSYLDQLQRLQPDMLAACEAAVSAAHRDLDFLRLGEAAFLSCPADSIDYAVMEHCEHAAVVPWPLNGVISVVSMRFGQPSNLTLQAMPPKVIRGSPTHRIRWCLPNIAWSRHWACRIWLSWRHRIACW
ncbi:hypothetical protein HSBAA_15650 [Vreelandella sulfidaeris]|uniref:Nucleotidyl transferase domain-containing protein n=1 Tax=Vreelandella sulfidaeris TaxID=115553 RepID=A0A455U610_9GAMM|nr:hypothetical protein HSBAA_15650 [Halomonas sulfidaeris]